MRQCKKAKGTMSLEFVVAISLFLLAFWAVYLQSTALLLPKMQRNDVRQPGADLLASKLITDPGYKTGIATPQDWDGATGYDELGLALYDSGTKQNILDRDKLLAVDGVDCADLNLSMFQGDFAFEVISDQKWECTAAFTKEAFVERPVYVKAGANYWRGVIRVWVA